MPQSEVQGKFLYNLWGAPNNDFLPKVPAGEPQIFVEEGRFEVQLVQ